MGGLCYGCIRVDQYRIKRCSVFHEWSKYSCQLERNIIQSGSMILNLRANKIKKDRHLHHLTGIDLSVNLFLGYTVFRN
ncbi:MAG TPA: hypothetical protein DEB10_10545 [Ruminococcaceae bacterium]|nr:hypothetical protein [Oscillospiraceae bacterium]